MRNKYTVNDAMYLIKFILAKVKFDFLQLLQKLLNNYKNPSSSHVFHINSSIDSASQ